jgi:hypothetical protein
MFLKIDSPFSASVSVSLFCLNIAEKAFPIYHGIEPGPISIFPVVSSMILSRSGSPTITEMIAEVSTTMSIFYIVKIHFLG